MGKAEHRCLRCSEVMVRGALRNHGAPPTQIRAAFVVPGVPTSLNPIRAFKQGLADEPRDEVFQLQEIACLLCRACGYLEMRAWIDDGPEEL